MLAFSTKATISSTVEGLCTIETALQAGNPSPSKVLKGELTTFKEVLRSASQPICCNTTPFFVLEVSLLENQHLPPRPTDARRETSNRVLRDVGRDGFESSRNDWHSVINGHSRVLCDLNNQSSSPRLSES